tara:strand:+ start:1013 stop:1384 length:372 start_codon:yes stop_codon:yes gene_type:complete
MKIYALSTKDVQWLGMSLATNGGITAWGEEDNGLILPDIVREVTGRNFLGTAPGLDKPIRVPHRVVRKILNRSEKQSLTDKSDIVRKARQQRRFRHAQIRKWMYYRGKYLWPYRSVVTRGGQI